MITRNKYTKDIEQICAIGKSIFFVGSRQAGKTTLMKMYVESKKLNYFYINFDDIFGFSVGVFKTTKELIEYINLYYTTDILQYDYLIFDEIIRVKNSSILLKSLIDKYPKKTFFCSASGNYEVVEGMLEGLAGRIIKLEIFPLDFEEFLHFKKTKLPDTISPRTFEILKKYAIEYLTFGSYPEVVLQESIGNKKIILKSIVDSIFQKDILRFIKEEKVIDLQKFMHYIKQNIGSLFSYENMSKTLGIKLQDIKLFIISLEKIYLLFTLNPRYTDKKSELSTKNKIYIHDVGIYNFIENNFRNTELDGKHVEQFVFQQLRYKLGMMNKLFFYRKMNESEIDFILQTDKGIIPIEVKTGNKDNIPRIFQSFSEKYNEKIDHFIKTTSTFSGERSIEQKKVKLTPYIQI